MSKSYIQYQIDRIFGASFRNEIPKIPKGVRMFRVKGRPGSMTDKARFSIKTKGRNGAKLRVALAKELQTRQISLPKRNLRNWMRSKDQLISFP